ncbi:MAG: BrnT family toxin [Anaerolineae bacterium]|nr:BrnT family toxin [Anaerolineae bacterium]
MDVCSTLASFIVYAYNTYNTSMNVTLGLDALGRILVVIYTYRGDSVRLISARQATRREVRDYEG